MQIANPDHMPRYAASMFVWLPLVNDMKKSIRSTILTVQSRRGRIDNPYTVLFNSNLDSLVAATFVGDLGSRTLFLDPEAAPLDSGDYRNLPITFRSALDYTRDVPGTLPGARLNVDIPGFTIETNLLWDGSRTEAFCTVEAKNPSRSIAAPDEPASDDETSPLVNDYFDDAVEAAFRAHARLLGFQWAAVDAAVLTVQGNTTTASFFPPCEDNLPAIQMNVEYRPENSPLLSSRDVRFTFDFLITISL